MKLKYKLIITFLSLTLVSTLLIGFIASYISSDSIEDQVFSKLVAVREIKKSQIQNYFSERKGDIEVLSATVQKLLDFSSDEALDLSAHDNSRYFEKFINTYGYYDFFLINNSGDIFYTVAKEADYQTNLATGPYANSGLGSLFAQVKKNNAFGMSDFARYSPSNDEPAAFIALPFTQENGDLVVVALQLSIDSINTLMQQRAGMGETGESYLIGGDLLMRSDSFLDPSGHSVIASFAGNVKNNGVDTDAAKLAISGQTGSKIIIDYNGNPVLSAYTPVNINGIQWGLLSEIDVAEAFAPIYTLYWNILTVIISIVVVVISVALIVTKSILRPLGGEPNEMQTISESIANGDLTVSFASDRDGDSVYGAMKKMTSHLLGIMSEITDNSSSLASAAEQTSALSLQSSTSLHQQQSSIEQVATAVEEMSTSIDEVAQNALNAAQSAQTAQTVSSEAKEKLTQTISDIDNLDGELSRASDVIKTLATDTDAISTVIEVIRSIADQTNLLALNAAIEAARAGEQGRGFAVVADEVRTLASKTQDSTQNIEDMISRLQNGSNNAVKVMEISREVCGSTLANAQTTDQMISDMNTEISNISLVTELIASAVEEQSSVSNEISQIITSINGVAIENSVAAKQVSSAGEDINSVASNLNELALKFKTA